MIDIAVAADDTTECSQLSKTQIVDVRLPYVYPIIQTDLLVLADYENLNGPEGDACGLFLADNLG